MNKHFANVHRAVAREAAVVVLPLPQVELQVEDSVQLHREHGAGETNVPVRAPPSQRPVAGERPHFPSPSKNNPFQFS